MSADHIMPIIIAALFYTVVGVFVLCVLLLVGLVLINVVAVAVNLGRDERDERAARRRQNIGRGTARTAKLGRLTNRVTQPRRGWKWAVLAGLLPEAAFLRVAGLRTTWPQASRRRPSAPATPAPASPSGKGAPR